MTLRLRRLRLFGEGFESLRSLQFSTCDPLRQDATNCVQFNRLRQFLPASRLRQPPTRQGSCGHAPARQLGSSRLEFATVTPWAS